MASAKAMRQYVEYALVISSIASSSHTPGCQSLDDSKKKVARRRRSGEQSEEIETG